MARAGIRDIVFGLAAASLLMGCVEGGGTAGAGGGASVTAAPAKKKSGSQDVEAPEVFQATDSALWDGRPSLGGIWVAAPEVTNPERAILFNPATGKSVTGALFKRERENPGPRLQLSSDAAEALGILAGQPTELGDPDQGDVAVGQHPGAQPTADRETVLGDCQLRAGPPRSCCKQHSTHRGNAPEDPPRQVCDHGHNDDGHRKTEDCDPHNADRLRSPTSLLDHVRTPSHRRVCGYPQALSPMGMNHNGVIGLRPGCGAGNA